jgi:hypothetical protein
MKLCLCFCSLVLLLASCSTTKKTLVKGSTLYQFSTGNDPANPTPSYQKYIVKEHKDVRLVDNTTYLVINDDLREDTISYSPTGSLTPFQKLTIFTLPGWKTSDTTIGYFFESEDSLSKQKFWYRDGKTILQAATIPIKIRSKIKTAALGDSIPSTTETGFNVGFLFGYKFSWNKFRTTPNAFGSQTAKYSITPGILLSAGAADLSTSSTRPNIVFPRKAAMITFGGSVVFGFNSVNIGYAFGWDHATGLHSSTWLYQGKMWNGIIVSLDLIK